MTAAAAAATATATASTLWNGLRTAVGKSFSVASGRAAQTVATQVMMAALPAELRKPTVAFAHQLLAPVLGLLLLKVLQDFATLSVVLPLIATSATALQQTAGKTKADRRRILRAHRRCVLARKILIRGSAVMVVCILATAALTYRRVTTVRSEFSTALSKLRQQ
jgi:hypothetical protein